MAEYVAVPQQITLHVQGDSVKEQYIVTKKSFIQVQRKCSQRSYKVAQFSSWKACKLGTCCVTNLRVKVSSMKCYCLGDLISSDGPTISSWIPIVNQLLLMTSIFLTYAAGVIPVKSQKNLSNDHVFPEDPTFSGSAMKNDEDFNLKLAWDIVKQKLTDSLNAFGQRDNLENRNIEFEPDQTKRPSCLFALAEGPRLRLLWATFLWLKEEVDNIPKRSATVYMDDCLTVFSEIIKKFGQLVCLAWLEKELFLKNSKADKAVVSLMFEKLNRDDGVLQNIRKSGKENLYAELIFFLRFGSLSIGCSYDHNLFMLHGVAILEDLVIALAECMAGMYLELISVDGNMSSEMNRLGLILCTLSTRALQRLRNEVMLNQWLHQNMEVVVSMYEDRFDLRTLKSQLIEEPSKRLTERLSWWKKLTLSKSRSTLSPLCYVVISYLSIPVKRTKELKALTGWRYYFSLFLELADISMPLFRTVFAKVSDAISFFLVCLIGRSLGLIYTGIRQSLRWK